jgi:hypothetical protein
MAIGLFGPEYIQFDDGGPAAEIRVFIFLPDSKTKAVLYSDRNGDRTAPNPMWTDRRGEIVFFAEEGFYDLFYEYPEPEGTTTLIEVGAGDVEPELRALGLRHTQNAPVQQVSVNHGLTFRPAGVDCNDFFGTHVDFEKITHPAPGVTEVWFGDGFNFTGTIDFS